MAGLVENTVFKGFAFYASVSTVKMMALAPLTGKMKHQTQCFPNPEDADRYGLAPKTHEDVERVQRCHLNDLENLLPFMALGVFYCVSRPDPTVAMWHFRIFTLGRLIHTWAYLKKKPVLRGIGFITGFVTCLSMGVQNIGYFFQFA